MSKTFLMAGLESRTLLSAAPSAHDHPHIDRLKSSDMRESAAVDRREDDSRSDRHSRSALPHFDHVVVVVEQNRSYEDILGRNNVSFGAWPAIGSQLANTAPFIDWLARNGASMTKAEAISHPNFLDVIAGLKTKQPALWSSLQAKGLTFANYSERRLPREFRDLPPVDAKPFREFPRDFRDLPTVSFVMPSRAHDMHTSSIQDGDHWLHSHLGEYAEWARTHNSLFVITWDEGHGNDHIPLILFGAHVERQQNNTPVDQYNLARTIEHIYHVDQTAQGAGASLILDLFSTQS